MPRETNTFDVKPISYRKEDGTVSDRNIIILSTANPNVSAFDVSKATPEQVEELRALLMRQRQETKDLRERTGIELKTFKPGMITYREPQVA